nr:hypothetical protein OH837_23370 [Streptomyces canus]
MTGNHRNSSITRRRALAVTGGTVAAGGLAVTGYQSAFADTAEATATASATSTGACMTLMSSVTEGPYYLDGALVRKDITEGKSGVPLTLRLTVVDATDGCTPVKGAAEEIFALEPYSRHSGSYTALDDDMVYDGGGASSGLLTLKAVHKADPSRGYKGSLSLAVDPGAENTGAGSGGGGTPPSGAPSGEPPSGALSESASPSASASS